MVTTRKMTFQLCEEREKDEKGIKDERNKKNRIKSRLKRRYYIIGGVIALVAASSTS
jgi:hypothetical protein